MSQSQEIRPLSFEEAIRHAASHVTEFRGRARRSEFWWTKLLILLVSIFLTPVIGQLLNLATIPLTFRRLHDGGHSGWWWGLKLLLGLGFWAIAVFALVCVVTQHYDERINSLWPYAVGYDLFYLLYNVIFIILLCQDSQRGYNRYGESPKYPAA